MVIKTPIPRSTKQRAVRRNQRIASGIIAGKSVTAIAREEDVSRAWASKLAHSSDVAQIIGSLVNSEPVTVHQLFKGALHVIADSFQAERHAVVQGRRTSLGPDHYARLTGAKRFLEFVTAGRAAPKTEDLTERPITLEDINRVLAKRNAEEEQEASKGIQ